VVFRIHGYALVQARADVGKLSGGQLRDVALRQAFSRQLSASQLSAISFQQSALGVGGACGG
jgi:hypothetical protein